MASKGRNNALRASKRIRGKEREEHFANGGTLAAWRGVTRVNTDRKKAADKMACRKRGGWA